MLNLDELPVYRLARKNMVERQIASRGIRNDTLLSAMGEIPRHQFVRSALWPDAYQDRPLPIACGQTISQPYMVAAMTNALALEAGMRVLEIGTGSGYQTAVLLAMGCEVCGLERYSELLNQSCENLKNLGFEKPDLRLGNAYDGWPEDSVFDRILVAAAAKDFPIKLVDNLRTNGYCVIPEGESSQELVLYKRTESGLEREALMPVRFVPLVNEDPQSSRDNHSKNSF